MIAVEPAGGRGGKLVLTVAGRPPEKVDPKDGATQRAAARKLGVTEADVMSALAAYEANRSGPPAAQRFPVESWNPGAPAVKTERIGGEPQWETLKRAFLQRVEHHRWPGRTQLCTLDVDLRPGMAPFTPGEGERVLSACVGPQPVAWWLSRHGGFHFVFQADPPGTGNGLNAEQKAGAFALLARGLREPRVLRLELLASTRYPPGMIYEGVRRYGVADLAGRLSGQGGVDAVQPAEVADWLANRGLYLGGRFPHEQCPFDPGPSGGRDPVVVHDEGVHCFRCASANARGTARWATLVRGSQDDEPAADPVARAAIERVHWTHAELLLSAHAPQLPPQLRRAAYSALAAVFHDVDTATAMTLWGSRPAIVRGEAGWMEWPTGQLLPIGPTSTRTLPWATCPEAVEVAGRSPTARLAGYVPIRPTRCLVDAPTEHDGVIVAPLVDVKDALLSCEPPDDRTAIGQLAELLPGFTPQHEKALRILVVAGMRAALAPATPSFLLVDGESGAGKGFLTALAAGILGQLRPAKIRPNMTPDDILRTIGENVVAGASILHLDEVGKIESMWASSGPLLVLDGHVAWHQLYVGPVTAPLTAALVLTGSSLPRGLTTMREFCRRMVRVTLSPVKRLESETWEKVFVDHFGTTADKIMQTPVGRVWAEGVRRWARAECFTRRPWLEHAAELGASRLDEDNEAWEQRTAIRQLYRLWTEGPANEIVPEGRRHAGWIRCWNEGTGSAAWAIINEWWPIESGSPERDARERAALLGRLETCDAQDAVGYNVRLRVARHGNKMALRFVDPSNTVDRHDRDAYPLLMEAP